MKTIESAIFGALLAAGVFGCSVSTTNPLGGLGSSTDPGTAVKAQPLAGTINGKPFAAKVAIARPGFSGTGKSLDVYATDATCDSPPTLASGDHKILVEVGTWADGAAFQLDSAHSVTFVEEPANNFVTFTGRLEVIKAGTATEPGMIGLRADDQSKGSVEGQIQVLNCAE